MRVRLVIGWLVVLTMVAAIGYAQQPPAAQPAPVTLSLTAALETAIRNNPTYLTTLRARSPAFWARNNAALSLFTPTFGVAATTTPRLPPPARSSRASRSRRHRATSR